MATRQTRMHSKNNSQVSQAEDLETVDMENVKNNNSSQQSVGTIKGAKRKRKLSNSPAKAGTSKSSKGSDRTNSNRGAKAKMTERHSDSQECNVTPHQVDEEQQFEDDGNFIRMKVNVNDDDFPSDEGEINSSGDETEECEDEGSTTGVDSGSDTDGNEQERMAAQSRSKKRKHQKKKGDKGVRHVESKIDHLSDALFAMQSIMTQQGLFKGANANLTEVDTLTKKQKEGKSIALSSSGATIYKNAVEHETEAEPEVTNESGDGMSEVIFNIKDKQAFDLATQQLSSDEHGDTSDELINVMDQFIADCVADAQWRHSKEIEVTKPEQMLKDAEASWAWLIATPGNDNELVYNSNHAWAAVVDENYLVIGVHLDASLKQKIINHEYIDFARLVPKDKITCEDDH